MPDGLIVRPYSIDDRALVRKIAVQTAFMGGPASAFVEGNDVLADALTSYYTDYEPESCFVVQKGTEVVGYILGAVNAAVMSKVFLRRVLWPLVVKLISTGFFLKRRNLSLLYRFLISLLRNEFYSPDYSKEYPAALHINLLDGARQAGGGTLLMQTYLSYLKNQGVRGVHMASMSERAGRFFERHGFKVLWRSGRTYFSHVTREKIVVSIYGRLL